jgi:putative tricarboxylic transport membrane protein
MRRIDQITSIVLIVLTILGLIETLNFKRGSYLLPRIVLSGILFFALMMLVESFIRSDRPRPKIEINWKPWGIIVFLTFIYIFSIQYIGFYPSTVFYIFIAMYVFGVRKLAILIFLPVLFAIGIYLVFTFGFSIYLPGATVF